MPDPVIGAAVAKGGSDLLTTLLQLRAARKAQQRQLQAEGQQRSFETQKEATQQLTEQERLILNDILSQQRGALLG